MTHNPSWLFKDLSKIDRQGDEYLKKYRKFGKTYEGTAIVFLLTPSFYDVKQNLLHFPFEEKPIEVGA